jgi:uncharacterized membrane protein
MKHFKDFLSLIFTLLFGILAFSPIIVWAGVLFWLILSPLVNK